MTNAQLYYGGDIHTVDPDCPQAEAVAVRDGVIIAVGETDDCVALLGEGYASIDLAGSTLLPGFIDTHLHPLIMVYYDMNVDLKGCGSMRDVLERLREGSRSLSADEWLVGLAFEEQDLAEKRWPTRFDLDEASPDRPCVVIKHDGHTVFGNTVALQAAGITSGTANPDGGVIDRDAEGAPLGPCRENAAPLLLSAMPTPGAERFTSGAAKTFHSLTAKGITSVGAILQAGSEGPAGKQGAFDVMLMQMLLEYAPINLYVLLVACDVADIAAAQETPLHQATIGAGHRIGGMKMFSDGTLGSCTACMQSPFTDTPDSRGFLTLSEEEMYRRMVAAHTSGLQIAVHAIGDAANRTVVDLYARLLREQPCRDHRHRLEHASVLSEDIIADMARLGVCVSTQPLFIESEKTWLYARLGADRAAWTYPYRALLDAGVRVGGASDAPIEDCDVLRAIQCCVTREGFETAQCLTPAEAIRMYTIDAAFIQHEDTVKGSITPGKRADFVVLDQNPVEVEPERIRDIAVMRTVVGGETVYISGLS